ncbi:MAG: outer membrane protein assembly factor BamD [Leptolyngbya sp. SIO4C1]|nr:outer membrane protein assembly factor BamD [Leptolyngbya sp. SIO4C1]
MKSDFNPDQQLQRGVRALKRKDYTGAIATFESLCRAHLPKSYQTKAQMGLVRAYAAQQQWSKALALCQPLTQSTSRQVQDWARQKQQELLQAKTSAVSSAAKPTAKITDSSGFQPIEPPPADPSGFQPIDPLPADTGEFQPIEPPPAGSIG